MRIRYSVEIGGPSERGGASLFGPVAAAYGMDWSIRDAATPYRALVMVSRFGHCLNDLLFRWRSGALTVDIPAVVSNHRDLEPLVASLRHPVPPRAGDAGDQGRGRGAQLLALVGEHDVDLVVLARYMQVLSDDLCRRCAGAIINIHHSFLPAFKGAKPYHQALRRAASS